MALPASLPPAVRLGVCLPLFPPFLPSPTPSRILSFLFGSQFWLALQPQHFQPQASFCLRPAHSRPSLSSPFCSAFRFILPFIARYCIDYCPGGRNGSSREAHTWWISLTFLPGASGLGAGSWPGGAAGRLSAPTPNTSLPDL